MKNLQRNVFSFFITTILAGGSSSALAASSTNIGKSYGDLRLRYEGVEQDNSARNASGLTLRTRLGFSTAQFKGFSSTVEFEDSRVVAGVDDYKNTLGLGNQYSAVADPETTELDQALLQYKTKDLTAKVGRQVLTFDNHRFVGHVGWRQDRQTFDGASFNYTGIDNLSVNYSYLNQRNRIFAQSKDISASDHLVNLSYKTTHGVITGYSYLLEQDSKGDNGLDTYGVRFSGSANKGNSKYLYSAEYAIQESQIGAIEYDASYLLLEAGAVFKGITAKLGYEVLGSDNGNYGFSTPLATLHKFNGWADQFLATPKQGLTDISLALSGKVAQGTWNITYHDFSSEEPGAGLDDLGSELDLAYVVKFAKHYNAGIKYAAYQAGGTEFNKVDTDKLWLWVGASF